ncbi:hypothetical protein BDR04DRAFT_1231205 [Suillus decipiens]|nr:hypothetical protein BDR04DRAFT_1231205 [Suillus decipiens]
MGVGVSGVRLQRLQHPLCYAAISPSVFEIDSCCWAFCLTLTNALSSIGLQYSFIPLVILIDHSISTISLLAFKIDSRSAVSRLTLMSASNSIGLHYFFPPGHYLPSACLTNPAMGLGVQSDLDESIELLRDDRADAGVVHPDRALSLENLALSLRDRFTQRGVQSDLDETFSLFLQFSNKSRAVSRVDLAAAKSWTTSAEETNHSSALVAYQTTLKFLDQHVTLLSSSSHHFDVVRMTMASLAVDVFSCSIRHGSLTTAVELVEQGRAIFWTHLARFRTTLDELSFPRNASAALGEEFKQLSFRLRNAFDQSTEDQSPQTRQLTMQWDDTVSRIRMLPNFSRFLLPPLFSYLQKAAEEGLVIIVNAMIEILPTFQLISQIYVSSYTPTLATLVRARKQVSRDSSSQHFVAIAQGNPVKWRELKCVTPELAVVAKRLKPVVSCFTSLEDSDATVQGALDALNHNQWLHLACHGMLNRQQSFESSFAMCNRPLMIKDIIRFNWQNPEFAFLSACHTIVGDEKSPDESIHLAAAMQFSGFRSVIGSMWSVDDEIAQQVVSAFYDKLVDDSGRLDCTRAAVALHRAVKKSRRNNVPLEQQIVFVHIGV